MAYTKAPVSDTHNVIRIPTLGENILVSDGAVTTILGAVPTTLNYIDCFPLKQKMWGTDPIHAVVKREGWTTVQNASSVTTTANPGKVVIQSESDSSVHFAKDNTYYRYDLNANTVAAVATTGSGCWYTGMTLAVDNANANRIVALDNVGELQTWLEDGTGATSVVITPNGYHNIVFMNGYLFAAADNGRIYNSTAGGVLGTWAATDYIVPEIYPDKVSYLDIHKNYLVAFSDNSIEFFYDAGIEVGSPLARQESYTSRVGLVGTGIAGRQKNTAKINDDIYFVGRNLSNSRSLYRIRDFRVEEIPSQYVSGMLNYIGSTPGLQATPCGIETIIINNNPMIQVSVWDGTNTEDVVYFPDEDVFWKLNTTSTYLTTQTDLPGTLLRIGQCFVPTYGSAAIVAPIILYSGASAAVVVYTFDRARATSVTSTVYTEVIDFGINYYKHIARIDAVGDYGTNVCTLSYNGTPNYDQTYTACTPSRQASVDGYGQNMSWYNLGAYRRLSLKFSMVGTGGALHSGFDVEYNAGAA